jgi:formate-dependent nitrite reductase membrane component NrfD
MNTLETNVAPPTRDGRNIDQTLGVLRGEGALQRVTRPPASQPQQSDSSMSVGDNYYGMPALKEPVWRWYIPAYFYVGGLAGASAALGAASLLDRKNLEPLARATRFISAGGAVVSGALLIADLGRPARFVYMLRVFRPTSPMNLGTWIFSAFSASAAASVVWPPAALAAGLFGLPLSSYTGVLVTNTTVPLWAAVHRSLPALFVTSAATAAGSFLQMLPLNGASRRVAWRLTIASGLTEFAAGLLVDAEARTVPSVARPLREGPSGALWKTSKALTLSAVAVSLFSRKSRRLGLVAGALGTLGSLALRFAVMQAGKASARDPNATFAQQRAGTKHDAARGL